MQVPLSFRFTPLGSWSSLSPTHTVMFRRYAARFKRKWRFAALTSASRPPLAAHWTAASPTDIGMSERKNLVAFWPRSGKWLSGHGAKLSSSQKLARPSDDQGREKVLLKSWQAASESWYWAAAQNCSRRHSCRQPGRSPTSGTTVNVFRPFSTGRETSAWRTETQEAEVEGKRRKRRTKDIDAKATCGLKMTPRNSCIVNRSHQGIGRNESYSELWLAFPK